MNKVQAARLLKLADFLATLPNRRFCFVSWVGDSPGPGGEVPKLGAAGCGTTACAMGWATAIPAFRRLGLGLAAWKGTPEEPCLSPFVYVTLKKWGEPENLYQALDRSFDVAISVFGLTVPEARMLFSPGEDCEKMRVGGKETPWDLCDDDATAKDVARQLRRFVRAKQKAGVVS
jgi:hypothetical protein